MRLICKKTCPISAFLLALSMPSMVAEAGDFIDLQFAAGTDQAYQDAFLAAEAEWEGLIKGYWQQPTQKLVIEASMEQLDPGILGSAGPRAFAVFATEVGTRDMATAGAMRFSTDYYPVSEADTIAFQETILHEMAHVFGIGVLWDTTPYAGQDGIIGANRLTAGSLRTGDLRYVGTYGLEAYNVEFTGIDSLGQDAATASSVPIELGGGGGTAGGHWDEGDGGGETGVIHTPTGKDMNLELMTGWGSSEVGYTAQITIGTLRDLGWELEDGAYTAGGDPDPGTDPGTDPDPGTPGGGGYPPVVAVPAPPPLAEHALVGSRAQLQQAGFEFVSQIHGQFGMSNVMSSGAINQFGQYNKLDEGASQFSNIDAMASARTSALGEVPEYAFLDRGEIYDRDERILAHAYALNFERDGDALITASGDSLEALVGYERGFDWGSFGIAANYGTHDAESTCRDFSTTSEIISAGGVMWARAEMENFYVSAVMGGRHMTIETDVSGIGYSPATMGLVSERATGETEGFQFMGGVQMGRDFSVDNGITLTPWVSWDMSSVTIDGYSEEGDSALTFSDMEYHSIKASGGLRMEQILVDRIEDRFTYNVGLLVSGLISDSGDSGYARSATDTSPDEYTVVLLDSDSSAIALTAGLAYETQHWLLQFEGSYTMGDDTDYTVVSGGVSYKF